METSEEYTAITESTEKSEEDDLSDYSISPPPTPKDTDSSPGTPTPKKRKAKWIPPVNMPESEAALNKNLSKMEREVLFALQEKLGTLSSFFPDNLLLRILRKCEFRVKPSLKVANNYKKWYHTRRRPLGGLQMLDFQSLFDQEILYLTSSRDNSGRFIMYFRWNAYFPKKVSLQKSFYQKNYFLYFIVTGKTLTSVPPFDFLLTLYKKIA